uniref:Etoposide-induced protein 2.4 n=1 Tax=Mucochytrium quahogii TaxID=96639 RepID=A0A7S2S439_9STRA|mmetsp:Transcript_5565/g.8643  ORF Transcript_5565/g.8643 Transcript_5565/m.8643 type:complete len:300 (-) Transcript_5565:1060-1959(-)
MDDRGPRGWFHVWLCGFRESIKFNRTLSYIGTLQSSSISTQQCFVMNGIIFVGSIFMFNHFLTPMLSKLGERLEGFSGDEQKEKWEDTEYLVLAISSFLFKAFWLVPMYILSFVLNAAWYLDIAKQVYLLEYGKLKTADSMADIVRDSLYNHMLMAWVSLASYLVYYIPSIGPIISLAYTSWAIAFYCFDYKWTLQGWELQKRLRVFQANWVYMLGFGMPCALLTMFLPQFLGYGIYALTFPVCMIISIISDPIQHRATTFVPRSIRMFMLAEWFNLAIMKLFGRSKATNATKKRTATT